MRRGLVDFGQFDIRWEVGSAQVTDAMQGAPALMPFSDSIVDFFADVSGLILADPESRAYADAVTFAFWIRRASLGRLRARFAAGAGDGALRLGRGIVFHVAPSNVPVNYAYSLAAGLLCGNANAVRIPSKDFPQIGIINRAISDALLRHPEMKPYIALFRYGHDKGINDALSAVADVRVVWGGDATVGELRRSPMGARAQEVTFADRYSLAVIDAQAYLRAGDKKRIAEDFYNDTYLTDQNACTSPRAVAWMGAGIAEAKGEFWENLHGVAMEKYELQGVQAVGKLASAYLLAAARGGVRMEASRDNLITRVHVGALDAGLMDFRDNSGFFFEYECGSVMELRDICDDLGCQTISYIGEKEAFDELLRSGVKGIDRIVPVGRTMDFDLIWDGYNLAERLTRLVSIR